jgi:hypothetical protein
MNNKSESFDIPILFLIFNRLDTTKQVFEMIRKVAPIKLYIASDGPRENRDDEKEKVETVRNYVLESMDWDCEVKTLFRDVNLGCGKAVSEAITWFFKNEEMGIILEDDCLPSLSFFPFCKELLEKYKDNEKIYHIAGYIQLANTGITHSYYFTPFMNCWGWASWRRAWNQYDFDLTNVDIFLSSKKLEKLFIRYPDRKERIDNFKKMEKHKIDTWDYQWEYCIFNNNGICINPAKNLITNIGFGVDGTHLISVDPHRFNKKRFEITKIKHPKKIKINTLFLNWTNNTYKDMLKDLIKRLLHI